LDESPDATAFLVVRPEHSGHVGRDGGITFDTWLGDDLVAAHPCLLATTPLKNALLALPAATGFVVTRAHTKTSPFFRQHSPGHRLPVFWLIKVKGEAGRHDIGVARDGSTVVSRRLLDVLLRHTIGQAVLTQFSPGRARA
jgi:hypothetical protein